MLLTDTDTDSILLPYLKVIVVTSLEKAVIPMKHRKESVCSQVSAPEDISM